MDLTDAHWFYSWLAQVSASMVGIIGAVFATRIADYTREARTLFDSIQRIIRSHCRQLREDASAMTTEPTLVANLTQQGDRPPLAEAAALYLATLTGRVSPQQVGALLKKIRGLRSRLHDPWPLGLLGHHLDLYPNPAAIVDDHPSYFSSYTQPFVWNGRGTWVACMRGGGAAIAGV